MGIVNVNTSKHGNMLTQKTVNYADFTMAKNTAHSAIQMAMQEINQDQTFLTTYTKDNPWVQNIDGREVELYVELINDVFGNNYWEPDSIRITSNATQHFMLGDQTKSITADVTSLFLKERFSTLVPDFKGAMAFAAEPDKFTFSGGGSASISGHSPNPCNDDQDASKPGVAVMPGGENNLQDLDNVDVDADPNVKIDPELSYQPTDELIARLANSPGAQYLDGNYGETLGTADNPGVFFVEDYLRLNGKQKEGYGILVVRSDADLEYEGEDGATLDVNGNFDWNGLIIFEDAYNFTGRGTPTINGSILVGHTDDYNGAPIDIDISGNIHFQYDCKGEDYAKMAAAGAVQQNKYTRVVTTETSNHQSN
jgi:hypothetical protein